jgi:hypothetical protein
MARMPAPTVVPATSNAAPVTLPGSCLRVTRLMLLKRRMAPPSSNEPSSLAAEVDLLLLIRVHLQLWCARACLWYGEPLLRSNTLNGMLPWCQCAMLLATAQPLAVRLQCMTPTQRVRPTHVLSAALPHGYASKLGPAGEGWQRGGFGALAADARALPLRACSALMTYLAHCP